MFLPSATPQALTGYTCTTDRNPAALCVCYWLDSANHTYNDAQVACHMGGGILAVPNSQQTNDFIESNLTLTG